MLGAGVGAAILAAAPSVIPAGVLPAVGRRHASTARVVMFCAAAALLVGVLFGIAPAWQAGDLTSARAIAADSRTSTGGGGRLRSVLVVAEVATAVLLLVGAGLLLRTLLAVQNVDRGYRADEILTMVVDPLGSRYPTNETLQQFYDEVAREVAAVPGVRRRGLGEHAAARPVVRRPAGRRDRRRRAARRRVSGRVADYQIVSGSYFDTIDLPVVAGRAFDDRDPRADPSRLHRERGVRAAAPRRPQPDRPCASRSTPANAPQQTPVVREIVGVARQVKGRPDETEDLVQVYVPMTQAGLDDTFLLVRPGHRRGGGAGAGGARGDRPHRHGATRERRHRADARRHRPRRHLARIASARCWWWRSPAWRWCWRWSACSASSATRSQQRTARLRRAPGDGRDDRRRAAAGGRQRRCG